MTQTDGSREDDVQADEAAIGTLIGIALRPGRRAPMEAVDAVAIDAEAGPVGDHAGRHAKRLVTVLARADWEAALDALEPRPDLPWTTRRANLLVDGLALPKVKGAVLRIGSVVLEVSGETVPCSRMDEAHPGLRKALAPDWRGGLICTVPTPGTVRLGDPVEILHMPTPKIRRLP
ncbi:MAG: MOSC domain-containing protein [Alphaproteobacteria bacterium]